MICIKCNKFIKYTEKSLGERNYCKELHRAVSEIINCSAYNDEVMETKPVEIKTEEKQVIEPDNIITKIKKLWLQFKIFVIGR
jgi:hypothetical protein